MHKLVRELSIFSIFMGLTRPLTGQSIVYSCDALNSYLAAPGVKQQTVTS